MDQYTQLRIMSLTNLIQVDLLRIIQKCEEGERANIC